MKFGCNLSGYHLYRYRIMIPSKLNKKKLVPKIIYFTTKDLKLLLDFYGIPYEEIKEVDNI